MVEGLDRDGKQKGEGVREMVIRIHCAIVFDCQMIKLMQKKAKIITIFYY